MGPISDPNAICLEGVIWGLAESMAILDWLSMGLRSRSRVATDLVHLHELARGNGNLSARDRALWDLLCTGAANIARQLLIRKRDNRLDWGLRKLLDRVDRPTLGTLYWWMLLYQLVIFKSRGLTGYDVDASFPSLYGAARSFVDVLAASEEFRGIFSDPWEPEWESQVALEAALAIYERIAVGLGVRDAPDTKIARVSLFTAVTEGEYASMARDAARNQR